ncbi:MAG: response regulator [Planctomycetes bacterium]|nr:response regulator [Planctomycetota bacterium]
MAGTKRILVVDDDPKDLAFVVKTLEGAGYAVDRAGDGAAALRSAETNLPDLVVLDLRMPGMDGLALFDKLRYGPKTRDVPIIFVSAAGDDDTDAVASTLDAYALVHKPLNPQELLSEVHDCLTVFGRET